MFQLDDITNENNEGYNKRWPYIPDHLYRMFIIGASVTEKTNALLNLIKEQDSDELIHKIYLYAKDLNEPKYQFLINKREEAEMYLNDLRHLQNSQILWMMFTVILMITMQTERQKS